MVLETSLSAPSAISSPPHSLKPSHTKVLMVHQIWETWWSLIPETSHISSVSSAWNPLNLPLLMSLHSLEPTPSYPLNLSFFSQEPSLISDKFAKLHSSLCSHSLLCTQSYFPYCIVLYCLFVCIFNGVSVPLEYKLQENSIIANLLSYISPLLTNGPGTFNTY